MISYCAFLGHQPQLSIAEIMAVLPDITIDAVLYNEVLLFSTAYELNQSTIERLGGTIVIGRSVSANTLGLKDIPRLLVNEVESCKKGKVMFSLRSVGVSKKILLNLYRDCKESLRKAGRSSRYLGTEKKPAPAVALHDHDIISGKKGVELIILVAKQEEDTLLWIGKTIAAHDINAYTKRDIDKPVRDTAVGLLPPKLAQTLLNLGMWAVSCTPRAVAKPAKPTTTLKIKPLTVYDPFCGTGVIPMEALSVGHNVLASDSSAKAVKDTKTNTDWWLKELNQKKPPSIEVFTHDATKKFTAAVPDVIVTETTLGPNLHKRASVLEAKRYRKEAEELEKKFLTNCATEYPECPIVCMFPVWYTGKDIVQLEAIWKTIASLGYDAVLPTESAENDDQSIIYRRPNQFVGRQIVVLVPTKASR